MTVVPAPPAPPRFWWRPAPRWQLPLSMALLLIGIAVWAPFLAPWPPDLPAAAMQRPNLAPSAWHWFGTDGFGRDVFSRVLYGGRVSLTLALASAAVALTIGTGYGALSALLGGWTDRLMMRALDIALSMPRLLLLLAVTAAWSTRLPLGWLILLLGTTGWFDLARLVRGDVQALLQRDFVIAARAIGVPPLRLLVRHLLPHLLPLLAISATLTIANTIALETGLSYLGLGVQPPTPSWGAIMLDGADSVMTHWWITLAPGCATILAVATCHALGDALRATFDAHETTPATRMRTETV